MKSNSILKCVPKSLENPKKSQKLQVKYKREGLGRVENYLIFSSVKVSF